MNAEHERSIDMTEEKSFKFNCPHCGRHLEADYDMVGMKFDCPECSQSLKVPEVGNSSPNDGGDLFAEEYLHPSAPPSEETEPTSLSPPKITANDIFFNNFFSIFYFHSSIECFFWEDFHEWAL